MQRFWVQSFPDPGRRRIKWRPADRVGYETRRSGQTKSKFIAYKPSRRNLSQGVQSSRGSSSPRMIFNLQRLLVPLLLLASAAIYVYIAVLLCGTQWSAVVCIYAVQKLPDGLWQLGGPFIPGRGGGGGIHVPGYLDQGSSKDIWRVKASCIVLATLLKFWSGLMCLAASPNGSVQSALTSVVEVLPLVGVNTQVCRHVCVCARLGMCAESCMCLFHVRIV